MRNDLVRVWIHKDLLEEMRIRKEIIESKLGYKVDGGLPVSSQLCAKILKQHREKEGKRITVEVQHIKGTKRGEVFFL